METQIMNWMKAVVAQDDKRNAFIAAKIQEARANGKVFVSWTGGGNLPENRVYNQETGETLAVLPDTSEAFHEAWDEHPEWMTDDPIWMAAYKLYPDPDMPGGLEFLLNDNYEPEDFREYLASRST